MIPWIMFMNSAPDLTTLDLSRVVCLSHVFSHLVNTNLTVFNWLQLKNRPFPASLSLNFSLFGHFTHSKL